ncbi:hypothetical protein [Falsibacillus pallidus]|uniref:DUF4367 domain-containing protein n=1 Tax=Falsibacillus pallidus TaxID=493781 RepID=A0A370FZ42_9BACI|nr:hypothetical protein [Falsibacillus pallidus]RDI36897.1 hypothetical protein DFR59_12522 [Falsibacillus pallidus]
MNNRIKSEIEKIEIPKELHERAIRGVKKAKQEMEPPKKQNNLAKKVLLASAASVMIIGSSWAFGSSYIVDAGESLITKIFGSEQELKQVVPEATKEDMGKLEAHFQMAKKTLSPEEFKQYSNLKNETLDLEKKMSVKDGDSIRLNPELLSADEQKKYDEIQEKLIPLEDKVYAATKFSFEDSKKIADFPVVKPTYIPEGYKLVSEEGKTTDSHPDQDPMVKIKYQKGEFGIYIKQLPLTLESELPHAGWYAEDYDTYTVDGYTINHNHPSDTNVQRMMMKVPAANGQKGYYIVMIGDLVSKEDMQKMLLSMVEK